MNSASPGVINVFMPNKFYSTEDEYLDKLSNIMAKEYEVITKSNIHVQLCLLYTSPSPRDRTRSRMPSSA